MPNFLLWTTKTGQTALMRRQTAQMRRLICVFVGAHIRRYVFSHYGSHRKWLAPVRPLYPADLSSFCIYASRE